MKNYSYSEDSEKRLLSILLNYPDKAISSASVINSRCFYIIDHRNIYQAIFEVVDSNERVDAVSVIHKLRSMGIMDSTLKKTVDNIIEIDENPELYISLAKEIVDYWKIRESNKMIERIQSLISEGTSYNRIKRIINEYSHLDISGHEDNPEGIESIITNAIKETELAISEGRNRLTGLKFGFPKLDRIMSLRPGNCYCIAARPAMGKTSFALNIIDNLIIHGKRIYLISTEMQKEEIMEKFITMKQSISNEDFRALTDENKIIRYKDLYNYFSSNDTEIIVDTSVFQLYDMTARARALHKEKPLDIIIVDYLQQMELDGNVNRVQVISEITRKIKQLASELKVPVIELSQLSRKCEDRAIKKPILSDLRESGSIEQDMSGVIFLYRPSYYGITEDENGNDCSNLTEIIIAKNRFGKTGIIKAEFDTETTTFREVVKR